MNQLVPTRGIAAPALIAAAGDCATYRCVEFFTAQIRNPHTRRAYMRAVRDFCTWLVPSGQASKSIDGAIGIVDGKSVNPLSLVTGWTERIFICGNRHPVR
jgi:hypothetical protein